MDQKISNPEKEKWLSEEKKSGPEGVKLNGDLLSEEGVELYNNVVKLENKIYAGVIFKTNFNYISKVQ